MGVTYTPCVVGSTVAGSPAWKEPITPGTRVIQINEHGTRSEHLRFRMDFLQNVGITGGKEDIHLLMRLPNGEEEWVAIRPARVKLETDTVPLLGINSAGTATLADDPPVQRGQPAAEADPPFEGGDTIVAIKIGEDEFEVKDYFDLKRILVQHPADTLTFVVRRGELPKDVQPGSAEDDRELAEVTVAPNPVRDPGFCLTMGPVSAVKNGSPAAEAGLMEGDVVLSVDGHRMGEPFDLDGNRVALGPITLLRYSQRNAGQPIDVVVQREVNGSKREMTFTVTPVLPTMETDTRFPPYLMADDALGIAYPIENKVAYVAAGGAADEAGLKVGDVLQSAEFRRRRQRKGSHRKTRTAAVGRGDQVGRSTRLAESVPHYAVVPVGHEAVAYV